MPKGLFIGLGGAGVKTVARLKALFFLRAYNGDMEAMSEECSFIFYDTDSYGFRDERLEKMMGGNPVIDLREYVDAGLANPYQLYENARYAKENDERSRRLLEWAIEPYVQGHFPIQNRKLADGSRAQRMLGRYAFFGAKEKLEERIREGIWKMDVPVIWVFSSCCGGTGSAAVLDVLYLVDRLYREHTGFPRPSVRLVMYMPKSYIEHNPESEVFKLNSYATFWEINAFRIDSELRRDGNKFSAFAAMPDRPDWEDLGPWRVCEFIMGIDAESQRGSLVDLDEMYANTAELCYHIHDNTSLGELLGNEFYGHEFDPHPRESQNDPFKWSRFVLASGFRSIVKADDFLKEYLRTRFRYDLYGFGLLGGQFENVWPNPADRKKVAGDFAEKYIFEYLLNTRSHDLSSEESLCGCYMKAFNSIQNPFDEGIPSKRKWAGLSDYFVTECRRKARDLSEAFNSPSGSMSKSTWLSKIEKSVKEGVEKNILEFGFNYTYSLIYMVLDYIIELEGTISWGAYRVMLEREEEIEGIIKEGGSFSLFLQPKKTGMLLAEKMEEYRKTTAMSLAMERIRVILVDITSLLERDCQGIAGIIDVFRGLFLERESDYKELASVFKKTKFDVCYDYFPHIYDFVDEQGNWKSKHLFESLYNNVFSMDRSESAEVFKSIINSIKSRLPEGDFFFSDMALGEFTEVYPKLVQDFVHAVDQFIEDEINDNFLIQSWLHLSLEYVFNQSFVDDHGVVDGVAMQRYATSFLNSVPVFYPVTEESLGYSLHHEPRWVFCGASVRLAEKMGYFPDCHSFFQDSDQDHRLTVFKFEVGHNFYDYKYFPMLKEAYERAAKIIKSQGSGCHIHKFFASRDIEESYRWLVAIRSVEFGP